MRKRKANATAKAARKLFRKTIKREAAAGGSHKSWYKGVLSLPDRMRNTICQHFSQWLNANNIADDTREMRQSSLKYVHVLHEACVHQKLSEIKDPLLHSIRIFFFKKWAKSTRKLKNGNPRNTTVKECDVKSIIRVRRIFI